MHKIFQRFIDRLASAETPTDFAQLMADAAGDLDLSCFAYLALPRRTNTKPYLISTYPENWTSYYLRNHYQRIDPVIQQALQNPEPFQWGKGSGFLSVEQQQLLDEASQFGIRSGFTVPIHDGRGPIAALTFAADQSEFLFERRIDSYERVLQLLALYFHAHIRRKVTNGRDVDGVLLSPREFECLVWASQGKSAWEIGRILGISRNTAASYMDNAKEKLGVRTVVQAAMRLAAARKEKQNLD